MNKQLRLTRNDGYYLPLFNLKGLKGSITPYFGGDLKTDQHHFALQPASELSLFENQHSRNVIFTVNEKTYFLNGQTEHQQNDILEYQFGMLYQTVTRKNSVFTLETTSYIPVSDMVEVHQTKITNHSPKTIKMDIITAIPIYGRSADNIRDHRHVTSLLHEVFLHQQGVLVKPTLSFDERGHLKNQTMYSVFAHIDDVKVNRMITSLDDFIDGGSLLFPRGINRKDSIPKNGYETIGAIGFEPFELKPNESKVLTFTIGIHHDKKHAIDESLKYFNKDVFTVELAKVVAFFSKYPHQLSFHIHDENTNHLLKWVTLQPVLRRHLGNSFLPHHDYGRGGRGWRDLWQDLLALIMFNDPSVKELLFNNFRGIRIDGSNATIIGDQPGEFKADRNNIVRIWSDHGAWPLLTTKMYIDETGDIDFLLEKQCYFSDQFTHYTYQTKLNQHTDFILKSNGKNYEGTVLEHLLLQNIVAHYNVGQNGFVKLEDADWNDGLDMAKKQGETIAFTHFYANNLFEITQLLKHLNVDELEIFSSLNELITKKIDINEFFNQVENFNGKTIKIHKQSLIDLLISAYHERILFLRDKAWIKNTHYQSYINDDGLFVDSKDTMSLTGQTMALLSKTATNEQAKLIAIQTKKLLFDQPLGGYHLNSFYQRLLLNMGRAYGFAYGHKENGAIFSHMVMMYAYGLYEYGLNEEAHEAYRTLLDRAIRKESKVLAGIPEYFNDLGEGKYSYLTGSASWLLKLMRTHVFGLDFNVGKLNLKPKLMQSDFIEQKASIRTFIFGRLTQITYHNPKELSPSQYQISEIRMGNQRVQLPLTHITADLEVYLDEISNI